MKFRRCVPICIISLVLLGSFSLIVAQPPLLCQITTPAQCPDFTRIQCAEQDPEYTVDWVEQFDDGISIGWKPVFVPNSCGDFTETVEIDRDDETQCGGVSDIGTHIQEIFESSKVCWVTRACLTVPVQQGGAPIATLYWRTEPNGGGFTLPQSESYYRHVCQPVIVDAGTILQGDELATLDWYKCVPYENCVPSP